MMVVALNQIFKKVLLGSIRSKAVGHLGTMTKIPNTLKVISVRRFRTSSAPLSNSNEEKHVKLVEPTAASSSNLQQGGQNDWFPPLDENCEACKEMRYLTWSACRVLLAYIAILLSSREMSPERRGRVQHYLMFQKLCSLLHDMEGEIRDRLLLKNILTDTFDRLMRTRCKFMCVMVMTHWGQAVNESIYKLDDYKADFEAMMRLCEQLESDEYPYDTFNCAEYETFLRSLRKVARMLFASEIVKRCTHFLQHEEKNCDASLDPTQLVWKRVFDSVSHNIEYHGPPIYRIPYKMDDIVYKFKCHYPHVQNNKTS